MTCIQKIYHSFTWSFLDLTCFDIQCLSCWCSWSRDNCGKSLSTGFHRLFRRCRAFFCTLSQSWSLSERLVFPPILSNWHNFHFEITDMRQTLNHKHFAWAKILALPPLQIWRPYPQRKTSAFNEPKDKFHQQQ